VAGKPFAAECGQTRLPPCFEQGVVVGEVEKRVAPVEEDGIEGHGRNVRVRAA
jgi:hypothetical protein